MGSQRAELTLDATRPSKRLPSLLPKRPDRQPDVHSAVGLRELTAVAEKMTLPGPGGGCCSPTGQGKAAPGTDTCGILGVLADGVECLLPEAPLQFIPRFHHRATSLQGPFLPTLLYHTSGTLTLGICRLS